MDQSKTSYRWYEDKSRIFLTSAVAG
jgi:hypothetical protein